MCLKRVLLAAEFYHRIRPVVSVSPLTFDMEMCDGQRTRPVTSGPLEVV